MGGRGGGTFVHAMFIAPTTRSWWQCLVDEKRGVSWSRSDASDHQMVSAVAAVALLRRMREEAESSYIHVVPALSISISTDNSRPLKTPTEIDWANFWLRGRIPDQLARTAGQSVSQGFFDNGLFRCGGGQSWWTINTTHTHRFRLDSQVKGILVIIFQEDLLTRDFKAYRSGAFEIKFLTVGKHHRQHK